MTIKEIIQKLHITMIDAGGQESHFQSWLTLSEGIIDVIDALKALDKQEPVGQLLEDAFGRGQVMWFNKPKDESMLYTTPPQRTKQEPVAFASHGVINWIADKQFQHEANLYIAPQRTWVDLTRAQFAEILCDDRWQGRPELMLLQAQSKLKEKNTRGQE